MRVWIEPHDKLLYLWLREPVEFRRTQHRRPYSSWCMENTEDYDFSPFEIDSDIWPLLGIEDPNLKPPYLAEVDIGDKKNRLVCFWEPA